MPLHRFEPPRGRVEYLTIESRAVAQNLLGDPSRRTVAVYLPPGYDDSAQEYPLLVGLAGFTGSGLKMLAWRAFGENVPQRIDRLIDEGKLGPVISAFPDCFTSLGGNQYVNSAALGNWEDFLLEEMIPLLEKKFRVKQGAAHRAVFGKSSGGYGAIRQALNHGERWGGVACHSGDMGFDLIFRRDLPVAMSRLAQHANDPVQFIEYLRGSIKVNGDEMYALMMLAMAASYDPDPAAPLGIRLPIDPHTCELIEERWSNWLAHDPLLMLEKAECQQSLRALRALYIDCGCKDQYFLHYPARAFVRRLDELQIAHRFEEFEDNHSEIDYRLDLSLPVLYNAIS